MTKEEIAAFWKLGVALKPILDEDRENVPLTPEGEQALDQYLRLKRMMRQEIDESSSQQPQDSMNGGEMTTQEAYDLLAGAVEKVIALYQSTLNDATPKDEVEKFAKHSHDMINALHIIGTELFAKPKI